MIFALNSLTSFKRRRVIKFLILFFIFLFLQGCSSDGGNELDSKVVSGYQFYSGDDSNELSVMPMSSDGTPASCKDGDKLTLSLESNGEAVDGFQNLDIECVNQQANDIAIVVDNTGSVKEHEETIQKTLKTIIENLTTANSLNQLSLVRVSTNSSLMCELTSDKESLNKSVEGFVNRNGWTALYDGIRLGQESLLGWMVSSKKRSCGEKRKSIVVVTDGGENNSSEEKFMEYDSIKYPGDGVDTSLDDLLAFKLDDSKVPVFSLGVGKKVEEEVLSRLSSVSGGAYRELESYDHLEKAMDSLMNHLRSPYKVCINKSELSCGEYQVKISNSEGEIVTESLYRKSCSTSVAEVETLESDLVEGESEINIEVQEGEKLNVLNNLELEIPGFNDEDGTKELTGALIDFSCNFKTELKSEHSVDIASNLLLSLKTRSSILNEDVKTLNVGTSEESLSGQYRVSSMDLKSFIGKNKEISVISNLKSKNVLFYNIALKHALHCNVYTSYYYRKRARSYIVIPDQELRLAIRSEVGIPYGHLYAENLLGVESLDLTKRQVKSLKGLRYLKNLKSLKVFTNIIDGYDDLIKLPELKSLTLKSQDNLDPSILSTFTNLEYLNLNNSKVSNTEFLSKLLKLKSLYLEGALFSELGEIKSLVNLLALSLSNSKISSLSGIENLVNLSHLYLKNCLLKNTSNLSLLGALKYLYLDYSNLDSDSFLGENNYTKVSLRKCGLGSLESIKGKSIYDLNIGDNSGLDLSYLSTVLNLKKLYAYNLGLSIEHLNFILKHHALSKLNVSGNNINSLKGLHASSSLWNLSLSSNKLESLDGIESLSNLGILYLSNNLFADYSFLLEINSLQKLIAQKNLISKSFVLEKLPSLYYLDLSNALDRCEECKFANYKSLEYLYYKKINLSNLTLLGKESFKRLDLLYSELTCEQNTSLVNAKYSGLSVYYSPNENCDYQYITGKSYSYENFLTSASLGAEKGHYLKFVPEKIISSFEFEESLQVPELGEKSFFDNLSMKLNLENLESISGDFNLKKGFDYKFEIVGSTSGTLYFSLFNKIEDQLKVLDTLELSSSLLESLKNEVSLRVLLKVELFQSFENYEEIEYLEVINSLNGSFDLDYSIKTLK